MGKKRNTILILGEAFGFGKSEGNRDYTFSELGRMIEELRKLRQ